VKHSRGANLSQTTLLPLLVKEHAANANPLEDAWPLEVRGDPVHAMSGPSGSIDGLAPMCSIRRRQLLPRK
jgi:hypothetical protein